MGIFVDTNNTLYTADKDQSRVDIWPAGSINPVRNITTNLINPCSIFVTSNNDIYVDNGQSHQQVDKWISNTNSSVIAMRVNAFCYGLFVDIIGNLYCSVESLNSVMKRSFSANANTTIIVAGNGTAGSASVMLNSPRGIFVNQTFNLYVADCGNDRVQRFLLGKLNGTTVAGNGTSNTISLLCPTGVILDGDGYLFIVDSQQHRIVAQSQNGFRCIVGCDVGAGSTAYQLNQPWMLSFDSYGNFYVSDVINNRVQKFSLMTQFCSKFNQEIVLIENYSRLRSNTIFVFFKSHLDVSATTTTDIQTSTINTRSTVGETITSTISANDESYNWLFDTLLSFR